MTRGQRNELAEEHADLILAGELTAEAYVIHFEAQMHSGKMRKLIYAMRQDIQRTPRKLRCASMA